MVREAERLEPNEARFQTVFEQSPVSMQIFSPDGTTIAVNRAWEQLWGVTQEQVGSYNILKDQQLVEKGVMPFILCGFRGQATDIPAIKYEPDDSIPQLSPVPYRWVRSSIYPVKDADGDLREVVLMHEDITEHKETEAQLVQTEERYRRIFEATADGVIINDPSTGCVVEANPAVCRMHGYTYEEFIGLHGSAFIHPDYHHVFADFLKTIAAGGTYQCKALDTRKDGSVFHVEVSGSPILYNDRLHILAVVRDVTERIEAEVQYRSVFEATHDCLTIYDEGGFVVEANPAVCEVTGYTQEEILGLHYTDLALPEFHPVIEQAFREVLAGGTASGRGISVGKGGRLIPSEGHSTRIMYRGKPHVMMAVRDITEQVKAEEDLEQRVADRTRELSTLLDVSRTITSTLELRPVLEVILDQLNAIAESDGASILTLVGNEFIVLARRAPATDSATFPERYSVTAHGPIWERLRVGEPAIINDIEEEDPLADFYRSVVGDYRRSGLSYERSCMLVPMLLKDQVVGLVSLSSSRTGRYTEHHAVLTRAIAQQAAVAIENARLYEQAQNAAVLAERQRLSRELHDSVSQALYSIALGGKTALALMEAGSRAQEPLEFVLAQAERGLAEMRALIFELRPQALEQEGLVGGLQKLAEALQAREAVSVETTLCREPDVPLAIKEALYRIAQEAMHNIVKHARATSVQVNLAATDAITLEIRDNGRGFDTSMAFPGHIGLHSMLERANHLGGTLQLESKLGEGTAVLARFPLAGVGARGRSRL